MSGTSISYSDLVATQVPLGLRYDGKVFPMTRGLSVTVGRGLSCGVRIDDAAVSRRHARFSVETDGRIFVEDLGSRNGVCVNGETSRGRRQLRTGDRVGIGPAELVVERAEGQEPDQLRVLVVDDSAAARHMVQSTLEQSGCLVTTVESPFAVAHAVEREAPDLILLDVNMPAISGEKITSVIRSREAGRRARIVLFSDRPIEELERAVTRCGADGYLQKGMEKAEFRAAIEHFIARDS